MSIVRRGWLALLALIACEQDTPQPFAEALFVVDTDLPVPQIAARLRVDLYAADGSWYESRDIPRNDAASWPASFSVFSPDESHTTRVIVRLRTYPEGMQRDYRGERFADANGVPADGPTSLEEGPRLFDGDLDITPAREPQPMVAVDRLVLLKLVPGVRGRVRVTLRGACAGTAAKLSTLAPYQTPDWTKAETCTDNQNERTPLAPEVLEPDMSIPTATQLGTFGKRDGCDASTDPRAVCIPGGPFVLGSESAAGTHTVQDSTPERVAVLDRFWLDRHEVTVADLRLALAGGVSPAPIAHEGVLGKSTGNEVYPFDVWCTYSAQPRERETYPVNCVTWATARAACQFFGGDLPSETQWEYAAGAAGRPMKTDYPWGNDDPTCDRLVAGRFDIGNGQPVHCPKAPLGPAPADTMLTDVTPLGVIGMAGNMSELMLDHVAEFTDPCWRGAPQLNPVCTMSESKAHGLRGAAFPFDTYAANIALRNDDASPSLRAIMGFRCAYATPPGKP
jgi:formylglycine-generating enzyme required for sulfatase activity